jgi:ketosteroid isomerase-like protein
MPVLRSRVVPALAVVLLSGCSPRWSPADETAIREVMRLQEVAWDAADLEGYMSGYSDTICFIGARGRTCGREAVTANYRKGYPDPAAMGDLSFTLHEVLPAGSAHAWITGAWSLARQADTLSGGFSLLWAREQEGWRIVRDHSY